MFFDALAMCHSGLGQAVMMVLTWRQQVKKMDAMGEFTECKRWSQLSTARWERGHRRQQNKASGDALLVQTRPDNAESVMADDVAAGHPV